MFSRLKQMLIKEFIQVLRDNRTRVLLFVPPVIQMMIFGYAATFEVRNVSIALLDQDRTPESRELLSRFTSSGYFRLRSLPESEKQINEGIDRGDYAIAVRILPGFAGLLGKGQTARVQVIVDSTNSNTALIAVGYVSRITSGFAADFQQERFARTSPHLAGRVPRIEMDERPWFNSNLRSRWFFVPGVIATITTVIVTTLTAFAVVREREIGTLEQILVTPISRWEFILGKTLPFFLIGLFDVALVATVGTLWFRVPFRGSLLVLLAGTVSFLVCQLSVGLLISTLSRTQQQAMVTAFFFIMPAITFSGFGFPIRSMPELMQYLSYLDPLRYFLLIIRGVYLKGVGFDVLWPQMAALAGLGTVLLSLSVSRFQKSLE
jgi:ABC-2 type transport system permease protein